MSQGGIINSQISPPAVATSYVTNAGTAIPAANVLNVLGAGATTTSGAGNTITVTVVGEGIPWTDTSGAFTAAINNGYFLTAASTPLLPAAPAQGSVVHILVDTAGAAVVTANAGQFIHIAGVTSLAAGTAANTARGDALQLTYRIATTTWFAVVSPVGGWIVT